METTEHIAEEYMRHCLKWFTTSNIKAKGNKEADISAIDKKENKYWVECQVTHKKHWALKSRAEEKDFHEISRKEGPKKAWRHRNSVDFFIKQKFGDPDIKEEIKKYGFNEGDYKRIIVCWQINEKESKEVLNYAKKNGIDEIWELKDKLKILMGGIGETYYFDDILRTLQLVNRCK
jgi:hypothetical protein